MEKIKNIEIDEECAIFDVFDIRKNVVRVNNFCVNCGKKLRHNVAKRCNSCAGKMPRSSNQLKHLEKLHKLPRSLEQLEQIKDWHEKGSEIAWKLPPTLKQVEARRLNGQKSGKLPSTKVQLEVLDRGREAAIKKRRENPSEKQLNNYVSSWEDKFYNEYLFPIFRDCDLRRQYRLPGLNHPFDFAIVECKVLIEVDGDRWHGHSGNPDWDKDSLRKMDKINKFIENTDWKLYRYNDADLKKLGIIK